MIIKAVATITTTRYSLIGVQDLRDIQNEVYIFDTRKLKEIVESKVAQGICGMKISTKSAYQECRRMQKFCYIDY